MYREVEMTVRRGGSYSANVSRMSVIRGGYIKWFPAKEYENKMKADRWITVIPTARLDDDGKVIGIKLKNGNGTGAKIRLCHRKSSGMHHIPISTKNIGIAVVAEGSPSHGVVRVEVEEDGFLSSRWRHVRERGKNY